MDKVQPTIPNVEFLKRKAKCLKKQLGITHTAALDLLVKNYGYNSWNDFTAHNK